MKIVSILITFLTVSTIWGQNNYPDSIFSFYPLDNGNYWEYNVYGGSDPIHLEYEYSYWVKVIGDTILENGKNYKILSRGYFNYSFTDQIFERIDSSTTSVYRFDGVGEYKIDSLASSEGDTIASSRYTHSNLGTYCTLVLQRDIYGHNLKVKYLNDFGGIPNVEYELAEKIGLIANYSWEVMSHEEYLQYAKIKNNEYGIPTDVKLIRNFPQNFSLYQNFPNPFNPTTTISYSIPQSGLVQLKVYDMLGREVVSLVNEEQTRGKHQVVFNAENLSSGIYFYKLQSGSFTETKKLMLLK